MLGKLCFLILSVGVIGCLLLVMRQQRVETYHQMAVMQRELASMDRAVQAMQAKIAQREVPDNVTKLASSLGSLRSIGVEDAIYQRSRTTAPNTVVVDTRTPRRESNSTKPAPRDR